MLMNSLGRALVDAINTKFLHVGQYVECTYNIFYQKKILSRAYVSYSQNKAHVQKESVLRHYTFYTYHSKMIKPSAFKL